MDKRYQVFVSSTYEDLKEERAYVISMLMKGRHIPASMESFTAGGQPPWDKITKSIDESDYYVLIIAGRYGSVDPEEGISYTEKEYNYALAKGIPILAFIHRNPGSLSADKTETAYREKLEDFIRTVKNSSVRTIDQWDNLHELGGLVSTALTNEIKEHPGTGWVRANRVANEDLLAEINELRKENDHLKFKLENTINNKEKLNLASLDSDYLIRLEFHDYNEYETFIGERTYNITWKALFSDLSNELLKEPTENSLKDYLLQKLSIHYDLPYQVSIKMEDNVINTIRTQFIAYGLIETKIGRHGGDPFLIWILTDSGKRFMLDCNSIKHTQSSPSSPAL